MLSAADKHAAFGISGLLSQRPAQKAAASVSFALIGCFPASVLAPRSETHGI